ncbi:MAG: hypothetical protein H7Y03_06220 [Chitinophagaceae bacterium]|nr:hypothetical protein [Chitinophagaceae bacterium]
MKKMLYFITILVLSFCGCRKNDDDGKVKLPCLMVKVVRITCASIVMQVLDNDSLGQDGWKDITSGVVYDNVFTVSAHCEFMSLAKPKYDVGSVLYVTVNDQIHLDKCVSCLLYDAAPITRYRVITHDGSKCPAGSK